MFWSVVRGLAGPASWTSIVAIQCTVISEAENGCSGQGGDGGWTECGEHGGALSLCTPLVPPLAASEYPDADSVSPSYLITTTISVLAMPAHSLCCVSGWLVNRHRAKLPRNGNLEWNAKESVPPGKFQVSLAELVFNVDPWILPPCSESKASQSPVSRISRWFVSGGEQTLQRLLFNEQGGPISKGISQGVQYAG